MAQRIGRYVLERILGTGSFATVWLAIDEQLEGRVAIKVLADNWASNPDMRRRFTEEARILFRLDDERIVRVHVIEELPDGRPYFVMTWADRATLHERLRDLRLRSEHLPVPLALAYAREILESLCVVHSVGVIHRDVKPSNVLFRSLQPHQRQRRGPSLLNDESLLLGDFGLAKHVAIGSGFTLAAGTPAYMAPEQSRASADLDHRADIFSVAAVLFEMVTGRAPFSADTMSGVGRAHVAGSLARLDQLRADVPAGLQGVIDRGLQVRPADRFPSAEDMGKALAEISEGRMTDVAHRPPPPPPPQHPPPQDTGPAPAVREIVEWTLPRITDERGRALLHEARARLRDRPRLGVVGPMATAAPLAWTLAGEPPSDAVAVIARAGQLRMVAGPDRAELGRGGHSDELSVARDRHGRLQVTGTLEPGDEVHIQASGSGLRRFTVVAGPDVGVASSVDVVLVALPRTVDAGLAVVAKLHAELRSAPAGPLAVLGVLVVDGLEGLGADEIIGRYGADASFRRVVGEIVAVGQDEAPLGSIANLLVASSPEVRASAAIGLLQACLRIGDPGARRARRSAEERLDALRQAHPALVEIEVLRNEAAGKVLLPDGLRRELRQVLGGQDIDRRLGLLPGALDEDRASAATAGLERWRTAVHSGRVPFASRFAAETVCRAYDRLWEMAQP